MAEERAEEPAGVENPRDLHRGVSYMGCDQNGNWRRSWTGFFLSQEQPYPHDRHQIRGEHRKTVDAGDKSDGKSPEQSHRLGLYHERRLLQYKLQ